MASHQHSPKSVESEELNMKFRVEMERLFRRELHKSFDLNRSVIPETDNPSQILHLPIINKFGKRCQGDTGNQTLKKMALSEELSLTNQGLDLELRLSTLPNPKQYYNSSPQESQSNSSTTTISSENPASCPPLDANSKCREPDCTVFCEAGDLRGVASLVLMGCANCYLYVMVSEREPKCPKCHTSILIDRFRGSTRA